MKTAALLLVALPLFSFAQSPAPAAGAALKAEVDPLASAVYDAVNTREAKRVSVLVRRPPVGFAAKHGAELNGSFHGRHARLVVLSRTDAGPHAAEFYFVDGVLRFVYETAEFFEDGSVDTGWKNFKGFRAWERRIWFAVDGHAHAEANGAFPGEASTPTDLWNEAGALHRLLQARLDPAN